MGDGTSVYFCGDRYEVLEPVGIGSMATVYRARDRRLGVDRAIKVLHPFVESDKAAVVRFLDEARTMAQLEHPNILRICDLGREHQSYFFVSEWIPGGSSRDRIAKNGPYRGTEGLRVVFEALQGLAAAHEHAIVHRDIRPENLLLTAGNSVRLVDFGLARLKTRESDFTTAGRALGEDNYAAPEQLTDARYVSAASDVYAVGATLFKLLTGKDHLEITSSGTWPSVHAAVHPILRKSLAYAPEARYSTAREMAIAVAEAHDLLCGAYGEPKRGEVWMEQFDRLLAGVREELKNQPPENGPDS